MQLLSNPSPSCYERKLGAMHADMDVIVALAGAQLYENNSAWSDGGKIPHRCIHLDVAQKSCHVDQEDDNHPTAALLQAPATTIACSAEVVIRSTRISLLFCGKKPFLRATNAFRTEFVTPHRTVRTILWRIVSLTPRCCCHAPFEHRYLLPPMSRVKTLQARST